MNKKKLMSKIITAAIAGGVLISSGTAAFAASNTKNPSVTNGTKQEARMNKKVSTDTIKSKLDKLVASGTITEAQETSILNKISQEQAERQTEMDKVKTMTEAERKTYFESKKTAEKADIISSLVTNGTLTQSQADAVRGLLPQGHKGKGDKKGGRPSTKKIKIQLDALVTAGTITQDDETKIINYFTGKQNERKAEMDKVKTMTKAERKTYFESKKTGNKTDMFSELVSSGIITQDKADAIKAAMPAPKTHNSSSTPANN